MAPAAPALTNLEGLPFRYNRLARIVPLPDLVPPYPQGDSALSVSCRRRNAIVPALIAGLCGINLVACGPNDAPTVNRDQEQAQKAQTVVPAIDTSETLALEELDTVARTAPLTSSKLCNLELLGGVRASNEAIEPKDPATTEFHGWVGDETTSMRPTDARLRFVTPDRQRAWESPVGAPVARKDVAKNTNIPTLENAGFQATVDLMALPRGEYRVYLVFSGPDGRYRCDNGRRLVR